VLDKSQRNIMGNWPKKFDKPKVSIACFTYNHERFIKDAIDSFLEQETDFPFEIVIGEDCSTDSTYEILIEYQEKYPDLIKILHSNKNEGPVGNWLKTLRGCSGDFIAMCDGDDYWTDCNKLMKQLKLLESDATYSGVYHAVNLVDKDLKLFGKMPKKGEDFLSISDFINSWYLIPTCGVMFRNFFLNDNYDKDLKIFKNIEYVADYLIDALISERGIYKFHDDNMADYRFLQDSDSFSSLRGLAIRDDLLKSRDNLNLHLGYKYSNEIDKSKDRVHMILLLRCLKEEGIILFFQRFFNLKITYKYKFIINLIQYLKLKF
jgi:glycosyltransferase involved in cell wall biosynthesis